MRRFFPIRCAQGQNEGIAHGTPIQNLPWAEVLAGEPLSDVEVFLKVDFGLLDIPEGTH